MYDNQGKTSSLYQTLVMATKLSEKLCLTWSGDYESLKLFVKDDLNLEGALSHEYEYDRTI